MKAVICTSYGPPDVLQIRDVPKPVAKDHEILVRIMATCVNSGDVRVRSFDVDRLMSSDILYDKEDFTKRGERFDIKFDAVGVATKRACLRLLAKNGAYVSVSSGYASESVRQFNLLKELFEIGALKATIDKTYRIDAVQDAHRYVGTGRKKGNVVLKIGEQ